MEECERNYHTEEYKKLNIEMNDIGHSWRDMLRWSIVGSVAVFSWLSTSKEISANQGLIAIAWFLPLCLVLLCGAASAVTYQRVQQIGKYLLLVEQAMGNYRLGWEQFLENEPKRVGKWVAWFWVFMLITNLGIGIVGLRSSIGAVAQQAVARPTVCYLSARAASELTDSSGIRKALAM